MTSVRRACPFCGAVCKSQGVYAHVMNTAGGGHGAFREVPTGFETADARRVLAPDYDEDAEWTPETVESHPFIHSGNIELVRRLAALQADR